MHLLSYLKFRLGVAQSKFLTRQERATEMRVWKLGLRAMSESALKKREMAKSDLDEQSV